MVTYIYKKIGMMRLVDSNNYLIGMFMFGLYNSNFSHVFYLYFTTTMNITNTLMMIERIRVIYVIVIKSQVWLICHCLGLGH